MQARAAGGALISVRIAALGPMRSQGWGPLQPKAKGRARSFRSRTLGVLYWFSISARTHVTRPNLLYRHQHTPRSILLWEKEHSAQRCVIRRAGLSALRVLVYVPPNIASALINFQASAPPSSKRSCACCLCTAIYQIQISIASLFITSEYWTITIFISMICYWFIIWLVD